MTLLGKEISEIIRKKGVSRYCVSKDLLGLPKKSPLRSLKDGANPRWKTITKFPDYLGENSVCEEKGEEEMN